MSNLDERTLEVIGKNRLLRLLHVLVGLRDGHTAKEIGAQVGMDGAEVSRAMRTLQNLYGLDSPPAKSNRHHWILSPQGQQLAVEAERLLGQAQRFSSFARALSQGHRGSIRLGSFNPSLKFFVAGALGELSRNRAFEYQVTLNADMSYRRDFTTKQLIDQLSATLDYVIVPVCNREEIDTDYTVLYQFEMVVVTEDSHPLRHRQAVTPGEVAGSLPATAGLLVCPTDLISRTLVDRAFHLANTQMHVTMENPDVETRYECAREGLGIALIPSDAVPNSDLHERPWPVLQVGGRTLDGECVLTWGSQRSADPIDGDTHRLFVQTICTYAARFAERQQLVTHDFVNFRSSAPDVANQNVDDV